MSQLQRRQIYAVNAQFDNAGGGGGGGGEILNWSGMYEEMHGAEVSFVILINRAYSRLAPSQWETLLRNDVSPWLGTSLESALINKLRNFTNNEIHM